MGKVGRGPLQAISVVDLPLARLRVNVEVFEVVVEVHGAGAQMPAKQRGVGGEHSGDLNIIP